MLIWAVIICYGNNIYDQPAAVLIISTLFLVLMMTDLLSCVSSAGTFLRIKYGRQRNPWGYVVFGIAFAVSLANWILLVLYTVHSRLYTVDSVYRYSYDWFRLVLCVTYLVCSVLEEGIYFRASWHFVMGCNSSLDAGIYGFVGGFVRPFFYGIQVINKKIVILALLICGHSDNVMFYQYALPLMLQMWMFFLFYSGRKNRMKPCICLELKCWRPFVEIWWNVARERYKSRNPEALYIPSLQWRDLESNLEEHSKDQDEGKEPMPSKSAPNQ